MATQSATLSAQSQSRSPVSLFYPGIAVFAAAVIIFGFARTYYLKEFFGTPFSAVARAAAWRSDDHLDSAIYRADYARREGPHRHPPTPGCRGGVPRGGDHHHRTGSGSTRCTARPSPSRGKSADVHGRPVRRHHRLRHTGGGSSSLPATPRASQAPDSGGNHRYSAAGSRTLAAAVSTQRSSVFLRLS